MQENIYTMAILPAKPGRLGDLLNTLRALADATRQEHGCIEYGFYQDNDRSETVISWERWLDQEAEDSHWETSHLKDAMTQMDEILMSKPQVFKSTKVI